jgi:hypothetical protein
MLGRSTGEPAHCGFWSGRGKHRMGGVAFCQLLTFPRFPPKDPARKCAGFLRHGAAGGVLGRRIRVGADGKQPNLACLP